MTTFIKRVVTMWRNARHKHTWVTSRNWAILDGNLVVLRTHSCGVCGSKENRLILMATAEQLTEAHSKVITIPPKVGTL